MFSCEIYKINRYSHTGTNKRRIFYGKIYINSTHIYMTNVLMQNLQNQYNSHNGTYKKKDLLQKD